MISVLSAVMALHKHPQPHRFHTAKLRLLGFMSNDGFRYASFRVVQEVWQAEPVEERRGQHCLREDAAMVLSSRLMLLQQALPLPLSIFRLPLLPPLPLLASASRSSRYFRTVTFSPFEVTSGQCRSDSRFENPRVRREGFHGEVWSGGRTLRCSVASESGGSGMAGASSDPPPMYRANVGVCLINDKNEIFVAQRLDITDAWQMPQGGIDGEEDPRTAAFRELREETGVTSAEYLGETPEWLTYDFPPDVKAKLKTLWGTEWNGQAQKWFLFKFTGNENEINLLGDGSEKPEFSEWKWVSVEDVVNHAVEFKKGVYQQALKHLVKLMK